MLAADFAILVAVAIVECSCAEHLPDGQRLQLFYDRRSKAPIGPIGLLPRALPPLGSGLTTSSV